MPFNVSQSVHSSLSLNPHLPSTPIFISGRFMRRVPSCYPKSLTFSPEFFSASTQSISGKLKSKNRRKQGSCCCSVLCLIFRCWSFIGWSYSCLSQFFKVNQLQSPTYFRERNLLFLLIKALSTSFTFEIFFQSSFEHWVFLLSDFSTRAIKFISLLPRFFFETDGVLIVGLRVQAESESWEC